MKLYKITINPVEFNKIPIDEKAFIICLGNLVNNIFSKLNMIILLVGYKGDKVNKLLNMDQTLRYFIELAGIIYECQNTINKALNNETMSVEYSHKISKESKERLKRIRSVHTQPLKDVRCQLAAHYDFEEIKKILQEFELDEYVYYIGEKRNLSRFRFGDIIRGIALNKIYSNSKTKVDEISEKAFSTFRDQAIDLSNDIYCYFDEILKKIIEKYNVEFETEQIEEIEVKSADELNIPFFIKWSSY